MNKKSYSRIALLLSVVFLIIWGIMGTGTSLAWFVDTDEEIRNVFNFAEFELEVEYRTADGDYADLEGATDVFDDYALYEPGYTQVVYLRVKNKGTVPFDFTTAVTVSDYTTATNVFGHTFNLQDHLKFGVVNAKTESELDELIADRKLAADAATTSLGNYTSSKTALGAGETAYVALIVRMPEDVDNVANYRGDVIPRVELGITVLATQQKD